MRLSTQRMLRDYGITIGCAILFGFLIRTFVLQTFLVPNLIMKPTLLAGDTVFAAKWPFWFQTSKTPERGDIIIFSNPEQPAKPHRDFVKRVIALPGDEVSISGGHIRVNGKSLATRPESSASPTRKDDCFAEKQSNDREYSVCGLPADLAHQKVPDHSILVLGDFRSFQKQKAILIRISSIKGKALWVCPSALHGGSFFHPRSWLHKII